jgi:hypothetical protein
MGDLRLGDVIDDFCVKCRRLTNHSIVSLLNGAAAKVRCRTCYSDHDFRNEQAPPSKKELARQKELYNAVLSGAGVPVDEAVPELAAAEQAIAAAADSVPAELSANEPAIAKPATKKKAARGKK